MKQLPLITLLAAGLAQAGPVAVPSPLVAPITTDTVVWSPLFQAAWDALNRATGPAIRIEPPNPLMSELDAFQWDIAKVMPAKSWKTWSGPSTAAFLETVNRESVAMTGDPTATFMLPSMNPGDRAAFAILDHELTFSRPLFRSKKLPMTFHGGPKESAVAFFGVKDSGPIQVLAWNPQEPSHAIEINCKDSDDKVVLYLPSQAQDFATAVRLIKTWRRSEDQAAPTIPFLHSGDEVRIPYLNLSLRTDFTPQLKGLRHFKDAVPERIVHAEQITRFRLHEKGASVQVKATAGAEPFGDPPAPPPPRKFIYDRPFFVFLWRDAAEWPYFGSWIGNDEAMEPFKAAAGE